MEPTPAAFLQAKRNLDHHSHHALTWARFREEVAKLPQDAPLEILEPGCGTGTMLEHLLELPELHHARLTAFDNDPVLIEEARQLLPDRAKRAGFVVHQRGEQLVLEGNGRTLLVDYQVADFYQILSSEENRQRYDILLTHAFLDLFPIPEILPDLLALLKPDGLLYALLTFDGGTRFLPELDPDLDRRVVDLYERSMVRLDQKGQIYWGFEAGSDLLDGLRAHGAELLSHGDSDWVVDPGQTLAEAEYIVFLETILDYVEREVGSSGKLDRERFAGWLRNRREQVAGQELRFRAHNVDVLARV